jgi:transposase
LEETQDEQEIITRVAALDIGKAELVCCVRIPDPKGGSRRVQEVKSYSTMTRSLQVMADRLMDLGVTRIVMEATSDYWKPPVRHEAPRNRVGMKGPCRWSVAAGR